MVSSGGSRNPVPHLRVILSFLFFCFLRPHFAFWISSAFVVFFAVRKVDCAARSPCQQLADNCVFPLVYALAEEMVSRPSRMSSSFDPYDWASFYFGKMGRDEASRLLSETGVAIGTFLLRDSSRPGDYSLSVRYEDF